MSVFSLHSVNIPWLGTGICPFRLLGDLSLGASGPWLLYRIASEGTQGISIETQILRLLTFATRYLDLYFGPQISPYNTIMKCIILSSSLLAVSALINGRIQSGFNAKNTTVCALKIVWTCIPPLFWTICITRSKSFTFIDVAWIFSQCISTGSDGAQFVMNITSGTADRKTIVYLVLITSYRLFYIPHWILRYLEMGTVDPIATIYGTATLGLHLICFTCLAMSLARKRLRDQNQGSADEKGYESVEKEKTEFISHDI